MVRGSLSAGVLLALVSAVTAGLAAQGPPRLPLTGNPTPGTPQPDAPKLDDRITLTGCVRIADTTGKASSQAPPDANTPSDSRYVLTDATREARVPAGTGTSSAAAAASGATYRLAAIESALSPFLGTKVEISGEVEPSSTPVEGPLANALTVRVEFVQKLAPDCQ